MNKKMNTKKGFTLIELLVVVGIIGILAAVVLASLNNARKKGGDAGVKSNLASARSQAEVFYNTNSVAPNTYTNVCTNGGIGSPAVQGIGLSVFTAARLSGLAGYTNDGGGSAAIAYCNDSAGAWAAQVPLSVSGQMWCVDWLGKSIQTATFLANGTDYTCN